MTNVKKSIQLCLTAALCALLSLLTLTGAVAEEQTVPQEAYAKPEWLCTEAELALPHGTGSTFAGVSLVDDTDIMMDVVYFDVEVIDDVAYRYAILPNNTVALIELKIPAKDVIVPDEIDGRPVTSLGYGMKVKFHGAYDVNNMTFTQNLTEMGPGFLRVAKQKKVQIPESVKTIYFNLTMEVKKGAQVVFPREMTYLGNAIRVRYASKVVLPESVERIADFSMAETLLDVTEVTMPAHVGQMGVGVLMGNESLKKVNFPEGLTVIPELTFAKCEKLAALALPASLTEIGVQAFSGCSAIKKVAFAGNSVASIGERAFSDCVKLAKLTLPDGLQTIGDEAFYGCAKLASVVIPESVTSIGQNAFLGCAKKLTLTVAEGSYAEQWANDNGLKVKLSKKK